MGLGWKERLLYDFLAAKGFFLIRGRDYNDYDCKG